MSSDLIEPQGGSSPWETASTSESKPPVSPAEPPQSSSSGDELTASLANANPDPNLEPTEPAVLETEVAPLPEPAPVSKDPAFNLGSRAEAFRALSGLEFSGADTLPATQGAVDAENAADVLSALEISGSATAIAPSHAQRVVPPEPKEEVEEEEEIPARRSWATLLLASYASAVTLGLVWVLLSGRKLAEKPEPESPSVAQEEEADPGVRAKFTRRLAPPRPIPAEQITTLGKSVQVGVIEVTPLSITSGPITLERSLIQAEQKPGGAETLKLKIRFKNTSTDLVLAPLDEAFVRERPRFDPDSYIETGVKGGDLRLYPLAVESEWHIMGQEFRELRPGEAFETLVVSAPETAPRAAEEMTWRLRLRTDENHTDDVGIRFRASEIQPEP